MNKLTGLLVLAAVILTVLFFYSNPDILGDIWLWIVGFIGYLIVLFEKGFQRLKRLFENSTSPFSSSEISEKKALSSEGSNVTKQHIIRRAETLLEKPEEISLPNADITVLRYADDGNTTLGLMFINKSFFAYTLEDTHNDLKIHGNTRIPEGHYQLGIKKENTPLTQRYRNRFDWFSHHIEIEGIPNYDLVYIHIGNTHKDTKGCLLIADGVNAANREKMILQSQKAYERFYKIIYPKIVNNEPLAINILDENWIGSVSKINQLEKA
jgi:hypothetical protein